MTIQLTSDYVQLNETISQARDELVRENGSDSEVIFSFDVFDTLIHRRVGTRFIADKVHRYLERRLDDFEITPRAPLYESYALAVDDMRDEAEKNGDDREVRLHEVARRWIQLSVPADDLSEDQISQLTQDVVSFEIECEKAACFPILEAREVVEQLVRSGERVVFVSDMYIGSAYVAEILKSCGYPEFSAGYASGDHLRYKITGRLFREMLAGESVEPNQVLHVGDNFQADIEGAQGCGINTIFLNHDAISARKHREINDHTSVLASRQNVAFVVHEGAVTDLPTPQTLAQEYGQHLVGPLAASFTHRLGEASRYLDIGALFFLARDGFLFQRIYDALRANNPDFCDIPAQYLYTSRLPTLRALSLNGISVKALISAKNHLVPAERSIANTFTSIGLNRHMTASIGRRYGVNDPDRFFDDGLLHWPPFQNLLNDPEMIDTAREVAAENRSKITEYFGQAGFFDHERVGLVDIGWGGSIQDQLREVLQDDPRLPDLHGFYLGGNLSLFHRRLPGSWMDGVMSVAYTPDEIYPLGNAATFGFMGALEELARAPQGTTLGYHRNDDGRVEPVLRADGDRLAEVAAEPELMMIQRGAVEYARGYARSIFVLDATSEETLPLGRTALQRLVYHPTNDEVSLWQRMAHTNDIGTFEIDEALVIPPGASMRERVLALGSARRTTWRHGSLRALLGPFGQFVLQHGLLARDVAQRQRSWNADRGSAPYHHNSVRVRPRQQPRRARDDANYSSDAYLRLVAHAEELTATPNSEPPKGLSLFDVRSTVWLASLLGFSRIARRPLLKNFSVINDGLPIRERFRRSMGLHESNPARRRPRKLFGIAKRVVGSDSKSQNLLPPTPDRVMDEQKPKDRQ